MNTNVTVQRIPFADFEVLQHAVQDSSIEAVQLGRGKMFGEINHMSIGSIGISAGKFSQGFRARGLLSDHRWTLGITLKAPALHHFCMKPGQILVMSPGSEMFSRYEGANAYAGVFIEPNELFAFLATQPGALDAAAWHQSATALMSDRATDEGTVAILKTILVALREHGETMNPQVAAFYNRCILELMTGPVIAASEYQGPQPPSPINLVNEVDRFLVDAGDTPVHISELCATFGIGRRTLYRAFEEVLGISPMQFLRRKRLGDVHKALLMAAPGTVTVEAIAVGHGFAHLGRFAREYRLQFGERPSETLYRTPPPGLVDGLLI